MKLLKLFAWCLVLAGAAVPASYAAEPVLGKDYTLIDPPQPPVTGNKIEVIEFFYYGCPYCFDLQPVLRPWIKQAPKDVAVIRVPVYKETWLPLAKLYYTLEVLGEIERLHGEVYDALHIQALDLREEQHRIEWAEKHGVDKKKFAEVYDSPEVMAKAQKAKDMTQSYGITGTPRLVVDGKYLTSTVMTGSPRAQIAVLDQLIFMARQERKKKP